MDSGGLDITAAKAEPTPSHSMPLDRRLPSMRVCVAAPRAMKVPVVSTMVTRKAMDMATMPATGNVMPKVSGCGMAKTAASLTWVKSIRPSARHST